MTDSYSTSATGCQEVMDATVAARLSHALQTLKATYRGLPATRARLRRIAEEVLEVLVEAQRRGLIPAAVRLPARTRTAGDLAIRVRTEGSGDLNIDLIPETPAGAAWLDGIRWYLRDLRDLREFPA